MSNSVSVTDSQEGERHLYTVADSALAERKYLRICRCISSLVSSN